MLGISLGQGLQSILQLRPLTSEQIQGIPAQDGMVVFNAAGYLQYYYQGRWYRLTGQCLPQPKEPKVDTFWAVEGEIGILLTRDTLFEGEKTEARLLPVGRRVEVLGREITFDSIALGTYTIEIQRFTECGGSSVWRQEVTMRPSPCGKDYFLAGVCWQTQDYEVPLKDLPKDAYIKTPRGDVLYRKDYIYKLSFPSGWRLPTAKEAERIINLMTAKRLARFRPQFVGAYAHEEGFVGVGEAVVYATASPDKILVMKEGGADLANIPKDQKVYIRIRLVRNL